MHPDIITHPNIIKDDSEDGQSPGAQLPDDEHTEQFFPTDNAQQDTQPIGLPMTTFTLDGTNTVHIVQPSEEEHAAEPMPASFLQLHH